MATCLPVYHAIVIGNPIAHSKSPQLQQAFAASVGLTLNYQRQYCPIDKDSFVAVVEAFFAGGGTGANVTVPFKEWAFELVAERGTLSAYAQAAGAVNTLGWQDGRLYGDNTDGRGLVAHIRTLGWQLAGSRVLLLGAGGASRGVLLPLIEAGVASIHIANRTADKAQALVIDTGSSLLTASSLEAIPDGTYDLVINATAASLQGASLPVRPDLTACYAYDMMYGKPSAFLAWLAKRGAATSDGLGMLVHQGALSFESWTGHAPNWDRLVLPF